MQDLTPEQFEARSLVYHALAGALYEPEAEIHTALTAAATRCAQILGSPACQEAALRLAALPAATDRALRHRYEWVMQPKNARPVALYESLYREGRLLGAASQAAEKFYRMAGVKPDRSELPDHASVELAFLGHLVEAEASAYATTNSMLVGRLRLQERHFLRQHPGAWLPAVGKELAAVDDPFYAVVGGLLDGFLTEELNSHWFRQAKRSGFPVLHRPEACNLCGLCIGACPPGALGMVETDTESTLVLDLSRCVGCDRCVRTCPQNGLVGSAAGVHKTVTSRNRNETLQILRRSPRATCPVCGQPTVSQAELAAVFSTLQPDPLLRRQMSLCVACKSLWNGW